MFTTVRITNSYADRENTVTVTVPSPDLSAWITPIVGPEALEDWWEDIVFPHTGDGLGENEDAIYSAEVIASDIPGMTGLTYEWN